MSCCQCLVDSVKTSSNKNTVNASTYGFDRISRCKFFLERVVLREEFCEFHPEREGNAHTDSIDTSAKKWKRGNQEDFLPLGGGSMENEHFCSRQGIFKYRLLKTNTFISIVLEDEFYEILGEICFLIFESVHSDSSCKYVSTGSNFLSHKSTIFRFLICFFQILTNISRCHRARLISLTSYALQRQVIDSLLFASLLFCVAQNNWPISNL